MFQIALMGHGVVGSGVAEVFYKNRKSIEKRAGQEMEIKYILDLRDFPGLAYSDKFIKDFETIVNDDEVKVVAEVMGGLHPAFEFVKRCLEAGKSVVTSNKELVAAKGAELLAIAKAKNVNFLFEASVGGGIPIIRPLHQCLAANEIDEIAGILNGTTNFILTKMIREGMAFSDALKLAQELGYAEKDPTADVEGIDACRKICILASIAFGKHIYPEHVYTEGISKITLEDVSYAEAWGGVIKLIGRAKRDENGKVTIMVSPAFVSGESQLASVSDVFNGILVRGDATGDVVFYGKGAGKLPTASAVVADVIDCVKNWGIFKAPFWVAEEDDAVLDYKDTEIAFYLRVRCDEADKALNKAKELFGEVTPLRVPSLTGEVGFVTGIIGEEQAQKAAKAMESAGYPVLGKVRVLDY
ncbi:homoserine dehydrogenase [Zongyangia hominis]|uniref:Homoserine dehydrogenase n=1 Tax=Zongyangia hominis TaxID=2763677 RepID=A0A926ECJ7_9FIRM|nr:homoserine dehydrogenase [Zongyangia hominis]MBC8569456.1 homoserine dehydrogenase [Zongyangia hominis]